MFIINLRETCRSELYLPGFGVGRTVDGTVVGVREGWLDGIADEGSDD